MDTFRSPLFIPGNQTKMLKKALSLRPDAYMPDLEDSVPINEKGNARVIVCSFLERLSLLGPFVIPRVNSLETGLLMDDLESLVSPYLHGISVGKIYSAREVVSISNILDRIEQRKNIEVGRTKLILWLETACAIVNAYEICVSSPRIIAVAFGAEDFTNDMAIERLNNEFQTTYAKSAVCIAANAAGIPALDTPYFSFRDDAGLEQDAKIAKMYGFRGKFAIHPSQIQTINRVFSPASEEVEYARQVIAASDEAELRGRGSTSLNGKVIDVPVVKRAQNLIKLADKGHFTK